MYNGSHAKANNKPRIRMNKLAILFIAVVMLIGAVVGSTVAFLVTKTAPVENKFTYANVTCAVAETFTPGGTTKNDVKIQNTGTTDAYIRAPTSVTSVMTMYLPCARLLKLNSTLRDILLRSSWISF